MPTVAICALTYQRPNGLRRLLEAISRLDPPPDDVRLEVVIVDNDPTGSSAVVVDGARAAVPWPIRSVVEANRGIPFGRNRALAESHPSEFVAFIDDDETPEPSWLNDLLAVQRATGAEIVTGPVVPAFEHPPPAWVEQGRFFDRPRFRTGERIRWATSSNVLIARRAVSTEAPFDTRMRYTGGSDTQFFMRARTEGHAIVWADDAVVTEMIPSSRTTVRWLLQREFRRGNTLSLSVRSVDDRLVRRLRRAALATVRLGQGLALTLVGLGRGRAGIVTGLRKVVLGLGMLAGLVNIRYQEYRARHGS